MLAFSILQPYLFSLCFVVVASESGKADVQDRQKEEKMTEQRRRDPVMRHYEWDLTLWATSQTRASLDATGRGIYRELLDLCYAQGGFSIKPLEPLCRVLGCTTSQFNEAWTVLKKHFDHTRRSFLYTNGRAVQARRDYSEFCEKQRSRRGGIQTSKPLENQEQITGGQPAVKTERPAVKTKKPKRNETTRNDKTRNETIPPVEATAAPSAHSPEAISWVKDSLFRYVERKWPEPDDGICQQVVDLAIRYGVSLGIIGAILLEAWKVGSRPTKNYAWFPPVIEAELRKLVPAELIPEPPKEPEEAQSSDPECRALVRSIADRRRLM